MANCFVSYKREDRERAEQIAAALRDAGHSIWWDIDVPGGAHWRETILAELDAARCVLVCWTRDSVGPSGTWVREEAERAKRRGVLLPLLLDRVEPPFGFGEVQALNLVGWDGDTGSPNWQAVLRAVESILSGKPPSVPPPLPRRRWAWAGGAVAVALAAIGLLADVTGLIATACRPDSGLSGLCRWVGLGPGEAEAEAWRQAKASASSGPLKVYLARYPTGAFAAEAQARLAACQTHDEPSWVPYLGGAPLVVPSGPPLGAPTEAAARKAMQPEVQRAAQDACSAAPLSELYRAVPGVKPEVPDDGWQCRTIDGSWRCRYDGKIACPQEKRQTFVREVCPSG
ncbi:MAG: toll/interleukin-1 receptor domain-containing protein [Rubrivivax sp.]|nr:toll/interleukin-1 receptor domain-containing protein [Rubrivivax sp.]